MTKIKFTIAVFILLLLFISTEALAKNIILKTVVVNPSKTKTQKALLKTYLPKEVAPENILDKGDLAIDYDIDKGLYYIHKKVTLGPGERAIRSVEIQDIWVIPEKELAALNEEAIALVEKLRLSSYFDEALTMQQDIEAKTKEILKKQQDAMEAMPQEHIAIYRENLERFNAIKDSVAKLDKLHLELKVLTPTGGVVERVSVKASWAVMLAVIIILGLISIVFFVIWQRQAKSVDVVEEKEEQEVVEEKKNEA